MRNETGIPLVGWSEEASKRCDSVYESLVLQPHRLRRTRAASACRWSLAGMTSRRLIFFLSALAALVAIAWLSFRRSGTLSPQALSVSFAGLTNSPAGETTAVFVVSNQWNVTIKRWAAAYLEVAPLASNSSPTQWTMARKFMAGDSYLKPGQTEQLLIREIPSGNEWRLRVPWSTGVRARVALALRKHSKLPQFLRVAPEYYAYSDSVTK